MRARAFALVIISYLVALAAAAAAVAVYPGPKSPLALVAVGDLAATVIIFLFSVAFRNSSFYDPYWSVAPVFIAGYLIVGFESSAPVARQALVAVCITVYGVRLTYNWARGWTGLDHEDWRYVDLRRHTGPMFQVVNFLGIMLFPTVLVYLGCVPMIPALVDGAAPLNLWDAAGVVVVLGGTAIEGLADHQLRRFARERRSREAIMDRGLWAWSRHPNYFGEISVWFGVLFFGMGSGAFAPWMTIGAGAMVFLFVAISIPMMEKRQRDRKPAYVEYQRRTSMLIPWPPRGGRSDAGRNPARSAQAEPAERHR